MNMVESKAFEILKLAPNLRVSENAMELRFLQVYSPQIWPQIPDYLCVLAPSISGMHWRLMEHYKDFAFVDNSNFREIMYEYLEKHVKFILDLIDKHREIEKLREDIVATVIGRNKLVGKNFDTSSQLKLALNDLYGFQRLTYLIMNRKLK